MVETTQTGALDRPLIHCLRATFASRKRQY
jgi:hypothetical protein